MLTPRKPSSGFLVSDKESYEILVFFLVLSVAVVLEPVLFFALYVLCGYIKCCGIADRLRVDPGYICPRCRGTARQIDRRITDEMVVDEAIINDECSFCYLGDMLCAEGGCELAIITRCSVDWVNLKAFCQFYHPRMFR